MTDHDKIIDKIKKLLALGNDPGAAPEESATALRQAQKLMEMHAINNEAVAASTIQEGTTQARVRPPGWEVMIVNTVAGVFGARNCLVVGSRTAEWVFLAPAPRAKIAGYWAETLIRRAGKERQRYMDASLKRVRNKINKTRRADLFAEGWVMAAGRKLEDMVIPEPERAAIEAKFAERFGKTEKAQGRKPKRSGGNLDGLSGGIAGKDVELHHGVGTDGSQPKAIARD